MQLSKSEYMLFLKHPAWMWLKKHDKGMLPLDDDNDRARLEAGNMFESHAEHLFPEGFRIGFASYDEYEDLPAATKHLLDEENLQTIFQGRFVSGQLTCIVDVLDRVEASTFDLYEIKASSKPKTEHEYDLAYQVTVLERCGYTIRNISVTHVNSSYVRKGALDYDKMISTTDITAKVRARLDFTNKNIEIALETMAEAECPDISPRVVQLAALKDWLKIYRTLIPELPAYTIYDLCRVSAKQIGVLEDDRIQLIRDIPIAFKLGTEQSRQVAVVRNDSATILPSEIRSFLASFEYPLYFLDYETLSSIVPYFDSHQPYKQVPFQYSLHIMDAPGAELRHTTYLHRENSDPAMPLCEQLLRDISTSGSIITWNAKFEKDCNKVLGAIIPEHADGLAQINARVVDLMEPFSNGWYAHKDFGGSASIKYVLPVLVPELSYKDLGIQEGLSAQRLWMESVLDGKREDEKEQILSDLDEYCGLDTLAMVEIFNKLKEI